MLQSDATHRRNLLERSYVQSYFVLNWEGECHTLASNPHVDPPKSKAVRLRFNDGLLISLTKGLTAVGGL